MDYKDLFHYENGILFWKESPVNAVEEGAVAGTMTESGYIRIRIRGKNKFAHRIVWEMFNGEIPEDLFIDHIDRNRSNNKIENLRLCTTRENLQNQGIRANNKSGYKGVSWNTKKAKWSVHLRVEGKNKFLGYFSDPKEAYTRYCEVAVEVYGDKAIL